jgi:hypothetical protein
MNGSWRFEDCLTIEYEGAMNLQNMGNHLSMDIVSLPGDWNPQYCYCENLNSGIFGDLFLLVSIKHYIHQSLENPLLFYRFGRTFEGL